MGKRSLSSDLTDISSFDSASEILDLFHHYRKLFIAYMLKNHSVDEDVISDIYQESFLVLYRDMLSGKLQNFKKSSVKNYLFKVGFNLTMKYFEQQKRMPITATSEFPEIIDINDSFEWEQKQEIVNKEVSLMDEICKKVLNFFYWKKISMREIAVLMNYKNEQVAKNRKRICMEVLTKRLNDIFRREGLI